MQTAVMARMMIVTAASALTVIPDPMKAANAMHAVMISAGFVHLPTKSFMSPAPSPLPAVPSRPTARLPRP
jgi:hypothetical protein